MQITNPAIEATKAEIEKTKAELAQLKNYEKRLKFSLKDKSRRERSHRLIERGAILESLIPQAETLTNEQIKGLLKAALSTDTAIDRLQQIRADSGEQHTPLF